MKQTDIKAGLTYHAKVSGRIVAVRVDEIKEYCSSSTGRWTLRYFCTVHWSGRHIVVKSCQRFRSRQYQATIGE